LGFGEGSDLDLPSWTPSSLIHFQVKSGDCVTFTFNPLTSPLQNGVDRQPGLGNSLRGMEDAEGEHD